MQRALRLAYNLAAIGLTTVAARVARRKAGSAEAAREPGNLTLLGLGLLALALGYRK